MLDYVDKNLSVLVNNQTESATVLVNGDYPGEQIFVFKITEDVETYASMALMNQLLMLPEFDQDIMRKQHICYFYQDLPKTVFTSDYK